MKTYGTGTIILVGLLLSAGCQTSSHKPVMFKTEGTVECPEWTVLAEVDERFYCIDRAVLEEGGVHDE